jgi:hypothetical protein
MTREGELWRRMFMRSLKVLTLYRHGTCGADIALEVSIASSSSSSCFSDPLFSSREERDAGEATRLSSSTGSCSMAVDMAQNEAVRGRRTSEKPI